MSDTYLLERLEILTDEQWEDLCSNLDNTIEEFLERNDVDAS